MKFKRNLSIFITTLILGVFFAIPMLSVSADVDGLAKSKNNSSSTVAAAADDNNGALGDALKNYQPIDNGNMEVATELASPLLNLIGNVLGVGTLALVAILGLVTLADLMYIAVPFTRPLLTAKYQLVSDECLKVVQQMGGGAGAQQGGMNGMAGGMNGMNGMGGMGMGGMAGGLGGGMGMGGMNGMAGGMNGMAGQQGGGMSVKTAIGAYFKQRIIFIVMFVVALLVLTSSALVGVGINLAQFVFTIIEKVNNMLS